MLDLKKVFKYPASIKRATWAAIRLDMSLKDITRYLYAHTKNARKQIGFREKFYFNERIRSFKTKIGNVYFRDNYSDPACLAELIENQYEFSKLDNSGSFVDVLLGGCKTLKRTAEVRMETHSFELHRNSKKILIENNFEITKDTIDKNGFGYLFAKNRNSKYAC